MIADTGTNAVQTRRAIQKLIGVDKVQAIVGGISLPGQVIKPYASYAEIPHLCVCSVTSIGDGVYNFTNIPAPEDEAMRWVEEAQRRGIKSVALLTEDYPSIDGHVNALKGELTKGGIRITSANRFPGSATDFRSMIADASASAPDVYFVEAMPRALDILGQQLKDAGIRNIASVVAPSVSGKPELFEGYPSNPGEELLTDESVREIAVARHDRIFVEREGTLSLLPKWFSSPEAVERVLQRLLTRAGRGRDLDAARANGMLVEARVENGLLLTAPVDRHRTAGMEPAAGRRGCRIRRVGPRRLRPRQHLGELRHCGPQRPGVRVHGPGQHP